MLYDTKKHLFKNFLPYITPSLSFKPCEFASRRVSSDRPFLLRTLPASFSNSANLLFSSSTSGFAVPSFSSLMPTTCSKISIASSNLSNKSDSTKEEKILMT
ncbi:LOW QUALITY PROTEIN: hypothetical protein PanWU01x14_056670 [Parasponia andersonii]|uniref:Uncharacterized protein n=1 Tax=Parasponia andersonii TaxID=3476 RepID=A0A2P5DKF3_PARAD|nr:LOW QUALITY PROTEIN: hypothetical protein PanWU01x14_056670 [Parasponia andersonii]